MLEFSRAQCVFFRLLAQKDHHFEIQRDPVYDIDIDITETAAESHIQGAETRESLVICLIMSVDCFSLNKLSNDFAESQVTCNN